MSRYERYGTRDLTFSQWHRTLSYRCTAIDLDFLEYCQQCRAPLALIELARDVGQANKPTVVLARLAEKSDVPAYLILYALDPNAPHGIGDCRIRRVHPDGTPLAQVSIDAVGRFIERIHDSHACQNRSAA